MLLDLVDLALERRAVEEPDLKGALLINGRSIPVALVRNWRSPLGVIYRALDGAQYTEAAWREGRSPVE